MLFRSSNLTPVGAEAGAVGGAPGASATGMTGPGVAAGAPGAGPA